MKSCFVAALAFGLILCGAWSSAAESVYYNGAEKPESQPLQFGLLKLAFEKTGGDVDLRPSEKAHPSQVGLMEAIQPGGDVDIAWVGASKAWNEKALLVPFPIEGGMLGYRIFLIEAGRQADFAKVKSIEDLKRFIAIQGPGWGDIEILRDAGLTVRTGPYKNLFKMTVGGRADFFPRAAFEALREQAEHAAEAPGLVVEKGLTLRYPFALTFYVTSAKPALRDRLLKGLTLAFEDGSYRKLFEADPNIRLALDKADLKGRLTFEIDNPEMPPELSKIDPKYWYRP